MVRVRKMLDLSSERMEYSSSFIDMGAPAWLSAFTIMILLAVGFTPCASNSWA